MTEQNQQPPAEKLTVYQRFNLAMIEIKAVPKDRTNKEQGFKYRGSEDIINTVQPIITKHGLFFIPELIEITTEERESRSGGNLIYRIMTFHDWIYGLEGDCIARPIDVVGESMDSGDKASQKAQTKAEALAFVKAFKIPTGDGDSDTSEGESSGPDQSRGQGRKWDRSDLYRYGDKAKGQPLTKGTTKYLTRYRDEIAGALEQGKGYATQDHLDAIDQEIARRIEAERENADFEGQDGPEGPGPEAGTDGNRGSCPECGGQIVRGSCQKCGTYGGDNENNPF